jgi:hypothetical protein
VVLESVNLLSKVVVSVLKGLVGETKVILLSSGHRQIFFTCTCLSLEGVQLGGELAVACEFVF